MSGPCEMADLGDEGLFWMDFYGLWLARILHGPGSSPCLCITTVLFEIMFKHLATTRWDLFRSKSDAPRPAHARGESAEGREEGGGKKKNWENGASFLLHE